MKKIAFVVIRYGEGVNGGAEVHCRMLAERLAPYYEVEVLTTTTREFGRPERDFPEGTSLEHGVTVRRFKPHPADGEHHARYRNATRKTRRLRCLLSRGGLLGSIASLHPVWHRGMQTDRRYLESQPDHTPAMLHFIAEKQDEYAAFLFLNFYFSQTVLGSALVPEKSILIPLAHPVKNLYLPILTAMFTRVKHIAFNTAAERELCRQTFGRRMSPSSLVGVGIEEAPAAPWSEVQARYALPEQYVLYLGRVTRGKLNDLIPCFIRYRREVNPQARLVLAGGIDPDFPQPDDPGIMLTGYVSDAEKSAIIRHAAVMVNPSHTESLSLLMLEALANDIPTLVNGKSEVMKEHCKISGAALWYDNERDFRRHLHRLLTDEALREKLRGKGPAYVRAHYDWQQIITRLRTVIESL